MSILDDRHINFLRQVEKDMVSLMWSKDRTWTRYVAIGEEVDQTVASQMKTLGAVHLVSPKGAYRSEILEVVLTPLGERILQEEDEAWG